MMTDAELKELESMMIESAGKETIDLTPQKEVRPQETVDDAGMLNPSCLRQDLSYSEANIGRAFEEQAALFAHYAQIARQAEHRFDAAENRQDMIYAALDKEVREQAVTTGEKITEAAIKNRIVLDSRYQKAVKDALDAKMIAGLAKDATEAFKQRRDMLIQTGSNLREEFKGEMRMKAAKTEIDYLKESVLSRTKS